MWAHAQRHGPPRPSELVKAWRFLVDATGRGERELQAAGTMLGIWHAQDILLRGPTAWDFIGTYTDLQHWRPFLAHHDFHHIPGADYQVDGRTYVVFAHDYGSSSPRGSTLSLQDAVGAQGFHPRFLGDPDKPWVDHRQGRPVADPASGSASAFIAAADAYCGRGVRLAHYSG